MSDPVQRIARYAEMRRLKPIGNLAASIHCIHPGTEWEAELTLADIEDIVARITQLEADRAGLVKFARAVADDPYEHGVRIQRFKRQARATLSRIGEDGK